MTPFFIDVSHFAQNFCFNLGTAPRHACCEKSSIEPPIAAQSASGVREFGAEFS